MSQMPSLLTARTFAARGMLWLLFLVPLFYAAYVAHVAVHEVLGHGVTALLCGGTFSGFEIHLFGFGRAYVRSSEYPDLVSAAGVLAELAVGLPIMALALLDRRSILRRATLASIATLFLVPAAVYGFWGTYFARRPSDWGSILIDMPGPVLRLVLVICFGGLAVAACLTGSVIVFRSLVKHMGPLRGGRLIAVLAPYLAIGIALQFAIDWNQVIEHVGTIPQLGGALFQIAVALLVPGWLPTAVEPEFIPRRRWVVAIAASWAACIGLGLGIYFWAAQGVTW